MAASATGSHILVIDNDPAILALFRDILEGEGYRVTTHAAPIVGPADVLALTPDLLILDLVLGRGNAGWQYLATLRADPATSTLPILVCTAAVEAVERVREPLRAWSCGVLLKPFDLDALLAMVRACLGAADRDAVAG